MARPRATSRCAAHLLTCLLALRGCTASLEANELQHHRQRRMGDSAVVGGYRTVSDLDSDNSTARDVAQFVVQHLDDLDQNQESLDLGVDIVTGTSDGNVTVAVVRGYSQVVSGTNYRLLLLLLSSYIGNLEGCLGAFAVEVYVTLDGQKSITEWGRIVNCTVALELRDDPDLEYGAFNADFQPSGSIDDRLNGQTLQGSTSGGDSQRTPFGNTQWFLRATLRALVVGWGLAKGVSAL